MVSDEAQTVKFSTKLLTDNSDDLPLKHSLTTSRSEVRVVQVVPSHFDASTVGREELDEIFYNLKQIHFAIKDKYILHHRQRGAG